MEIADFVYIFAACQQIQHIVGSIALNGMNVLLNSNYLSDFITYWNTRDSFDIAHESCEKIMTCDFSTITIEFKNVSFHYPNTEFLALNNVNIRLKYGETYLVVGKNGAGKSTFVKLLCRLYKPTSGIISLNGFDIQNYDMPLYLNALSVLFQDYKPLNLSIKDNIASIHENFDRDLMRNALIGADIYDKVNSLPNMLDTSYSKLFDENGREFSGGEAQKMMIAKTLYKPAYVRIFDEPTSGLDAVSEEKVYNHIQNISKNCLTIYITHRLSTGVKCDNIVVFDNGAIAESGNHKDLMSRNGIYALLFSSQAKLYAEDYHHE